MNDKAMETRKLVTSNKAMETRKLVASNKSPSERESVAGLEKQLPNLPLTYLYDNRNKTFELFVEICLLFLRSISITYSGRKP